MEHGLWLRIKVYATDQQTISVHETSRNCLSPLAQRLRLNYLLNKRCASGLIMLTQQLRKVL